MSKDKKKKKKKKTIDRYSGGAVIVTTGVDGHSHLWNIGESHTNNEDNHRHEVVGGEVLAADGHTHELIFPVPKKVGLTARKGIEWKKEFNIGGEQPSISLMAEKLSEENAVLVSIDIKALVGMINRRKESVEFEKNTSVGETKPSLAGINWSHIGGWETVEWLKELGVLD